MQIARTPVDEAERLAALQALGVLDTPTEERFDRLARLAAHILGAPIALVSLVDAGRQWFKAHLGLDVRETPRDLAFCAHAILDRFPLVVSDAREDDRFHDNPLVTGDPHVVFYAGVPIAAPDGQAVGTLCVLDHVPHQPSDAQLHALRDLAVLVEEELAKASLALASADLIAREHAFAGLLERSPMLIQSVDADGAIAFTNRAWRTTLGYPDPSTLRFTDIVAPEQRAHCEDLFIRLFAGDWIGQVETEFSASDGRRVPVAGSVHLLPHGPGQATTLGFFADVSRHQRALTRAEDAAATDELTGLANLRRLRERLEQELDRLRRVGGGFALALIDLDRFKQINDAHGHAAGDAALRAVATLVQSRIRATDLAARYGGDELATILAATSAEGARTVLDEIRARLRERPIEFEGTTLAVTLSVGVTLATAADGIDDLLRRADAALYAAKRAGRDQVTSG